MTFKKILYVVIFVLADIAIFAMLTMAVYSVTGKSTQRVSVPTEITKTTEFEPITTEETSEENSGIYQKSFSPIVNWMRKKVLNVRQK